jgi:hypothetical protein
MGNCTGTCTGASTHLQERNSHKELLVVGLLNVFEQTPVKLKGNMAG